MGPPAPRWTILTPQPGLPIRALRSSIRKPGAEASDLAQAALAWDFEGPLTGSGVTAALYTMAGRALCGTVLLALSSDSLAFPLPAKSQLYSDSHRSARGFAHAFAQADSSGLLLMQAQLFFFQLGIKPKSSHMLSS